MASDMLIPWQIPGLTVTKVLLLSVCHQVAGMIWYSPWLFAYKWLRLSGLAPADIDFNYYWPFAVSMLSSIVLIYVLAWILYKTNISRLPGALWVSFLCWFAFSLCISLTHAVFEKTSLGLLAIDMGKDCLIYLISGFALAYWIRRDLAINEHE